MRLTDADLVRLKRLAEGLIHLPWVKLDDHMSPGVVLALVDELLRAREEAKRLNKAATALLEVWRTLEALDPVRTIMEREEI